MDKSSPSLYVVLLFPVGFVALWCVIMLQLSRLGGWHRMAAVFTAKAPAGGQRFSMQSAKVGGVNYNRCLSIHSSPEGLHIAVWPIFRLGHPPLFLPWDEIRNNRTRRFLWWKFVECEVNSPGTVKLLLPTKVFDGRLPLQVQ